MVTRRAVALSLVVLVGACASPKLDAADAGQVAVHALEAAGLDPGQASRAELEEVDLAGKDNLGQPRRGEVWMLEVDVDGEPWRIGVDPDEGRVVRTFEPPGTRVSDEQVQALAGYREHDKADDAARRTRVTLVAVGALLIAAGYLVLRTLARRAASAA